MYNLKHYKPKDQTPSSFFINNIKKIVIPNKPILDIACGYGRNGGFLAYKDCRVVFIDNDIDCLRYIQKGKDLSIYGDVKTDNIQVLYKNLNLGKLPFPNDSVGGIIDIHYYNPLLIREMIRVLDVGGFFCFESISARGQNIFELPDYNFIKSKLNNFEIISYFERKVMPDEFCKSVVKIFAIKQHD